MSDSTETITEQTTAVADIAPAMPETNVPAQPEPVVNVFDTLAKEVAPVVEDAVHPATLGKDMCPNDALNSSRLESAFALLRGITQGSPADVGAAQTTFYNCISRILSKGSEEEAIEFMQNLLKYINANFNTHFTTENMFASVDKMPMLTNEQQREFFSLVKIFVDCAHEGSRFATAKSISWETIRGTLVSSTSEIILNRVKKFFNIQ